MGCSADSAGIHSGDKWMMNGITSATASEHEDFDLVAPRAGALIEALRGFGYTPRTAIADLIDNSISAQARNVWIEATWDGRASFISIRDDGTGMSEWELVDAMRPGSRSPLEERDPRDLGRFGLGLKTASFSQCRRLVVRTRREGTAIVTRCWDLDYVTVTGDWRLLKRVAAESEGRMGHLDQMAHGTIVLWEGLDRIVGDADVGDAAAHDRFRQTVMDIKQHLGMVFHRYLAGENRLQIWVNERPIEAWDPFLVNEPATQQLGTERLHYRQGEVIVRPFVLPHHSKLSHEGHRSGSGPQGWNAQQGFYVYRNRRLLVAGDWLGLPITKEEHYKLARIQVDLPNSMDREWQIDVRKSRARPPGELRGEFRRIANMTRERAANVYRHRGKLVARSASDAFVMVWSRLVRHGKVYYRLNREHPLIKDMLAQRGPHQHQLRTLLRLVEETVPVPLFAIDHAERPEQQAGPFEGTPPAEIVELIRILYETLRRHGLSDAEARARLLVMEPFNIYPELIAEIMAVTGAEGGQ